MSAALSLILLQRLQRRQLKTDAELLSTASRDARTAFCSVDDHARFQRVWPFLDLTI